MTEACLCSTRATARRTPAGSGRPAPWAQRSATRSFTMTTSPSAPSSRRISTPSRSSWLTSKIMVMVVITRHAREIAGSIWNLKHHVGLKLQFHYTFRSWTNRSARHPFMITEHFHQIWSDMYSEFYDCSLYDHSFDYYTPALIQHFYIHSINVIFVCKKTDWIWKAVLKVFWNSTMADIMNKSIYLHLYTFWSFLINTINWPNNVVSAHTEIKKQMYLFRYT